MRFFQTALLPAVSLVTLGLLALNGLAVSLRRAERLARRMLAFDGRVA
jgi:hypothetical protein